MQSVLVFKRIASQCQDSALTKVRSRYVLRVKQKHDFGCLERLPCGSVRLTKISGTRLLEVDSECSYLYLWINWAVGSVVEERLPRY